MRPLSEYTDGWGRAANNGTRIYYGELPPSEPFPGLCWFDTIDNTVYWWTGSAWLDPMRDSRALRKGEADYIMGMTSDEPIATIPRWEPRITWSDEGAEKPLQRYVYGDPTRKPVRPQAKSQPQPQPEVETSRFGELDW